MSANSSEPALDRRAGRPADQTGERRGRYSRGLHAEAIAALWLRLKGYRILDRRVRSPVGELDLVARRRQRLVFVEVKYRATREAALRSITPRQRLRIFRAAQWWLARNHGDHGVHQEIAFDLVLMAPGHWPRHVRDAFGALDSAGQSR